MSTAEIGGARAAAVASEFAQRAGAPLLPPRAKSGGGRWRARGAPHSPLSNFLPSGSFSMTSKSSSNCTASPSTSIVTARFLSRSERGMKTSRGFFRFLSAARKLLRAAEAALFHFFKQLQFWVGRGYAYGNGARDRLAIPLASAFALGRTGPVGLSVGGRGGERTRRRGPFGRPSGVVPRLRSRVRAGARVEGQQAFS